MLRFQQGELDVSQIAAYAFCNARTCRCWNHLRLYALEQRLFQKRLDLYDPVTDGATGHIEFARRRGEAAVSLGRFEREQGRKVKTPQVVHWDLRENSCEAQ